jgi:hypothetical protein
MIAIKIFSPMHGVFLGSSGATPQVKKLPQAQQENHRVGGQQETSYQLLEISLRYWVSRERRHYSEVNRQDKIYFCRRVHVRKSGKQARWVESPQRFYLMAMLSLSCPWIGQVLDSRSACLANWKEDIVRGFGDKEV